MAKPTSAVTQADVARTLSERRKALAAQGPEMFAKVYLPHLLVAQTDIYDKDPRKHDDAKVIIKQGQSIDFADFHRDLFKTVDTDGPAKLREAIIAPRGTAKSTIITIIVLYWAAFKKRKFVLWTSETASQVEELVASLIDEVETNAELREDFPHLQPAKDDRGQLVKWTDRDLVMQSGFRLSARGRGKATRGLRRGGNRPDVVICDDSEGEDSTGETAYPKVRHWLTRVIGPALAASGDIIWMNTLVDWQSVTGALIRGEEDWTRSYNVKHLEIEWDEDENGERIDPTMPFNGDRNKITHHLLWEEFWPQERIDAFKEEFGLLAYMFELRNRPMAEGQKMFQEDWLKWATIKDGYIFRSDKPRDDWINEALVTHVTAIDPAFGGKDYAAVCTVAVFNHDFFVREIWWYRKEDVRTAQVNEAVRQSEAWNSRIIIVESTAAQIMVADETVRKSRIPVETFKPGKDKLDRALPVAVRASQGHIYFDSEGGERVRTLREILLRFPSELHDDPVDAFVMAVEGAAKLRSKFLITS